MARGEKSSRPRGWFAAAAVLGLLLAAWPGAFPAYAETKISSVKVKFTVEEMNPDGTPKIEAETDSDKYDLDDVFTLEDYEEDIGSDDDEDNKYVNIDDLAAWNATYLAMGDYSGVCYAVRLTATDKYYFTKDMDRVKLSGLGAECVRLNRLDDRETLVLFVRFKELGEAAATLENMAWSGNGWLSWDAAGTGEAAASGVVFELRLYCGSRLCAEKTTSGTRYDFRPLLRERATYSCQIRSILPSGTKSGWAEAGNISVSDEMAAANVAAFPIETELVGDTSRPGAEIRYRNTGWQQSDDGRYWYRQTDGGYPQCEWREDAGFQYYFDADGWLVTSSVINWQGKYYYVNEEGRMLTEGRAPDGRIVQPDGTLLWPAE